MSVTQPVFFLLMNLAGMVIYWIASIMLSQGTLQIGELVAFMDYLFHVMFSIMLFCLVFMMYPKAAVSAGRIQKIFDAEPSIKNPETNAQSVEHIDEIVFDHVDFVYPDGEEAVLKDVSFSVKRGETIAFIGSTGSGKSTLINLIPRAYDVSAGRVLMNGKDIRTYDLEKPAARHWLLSLRKQCCFPGPLRIICVSGKRMPRWRTWFRRQRLRRHTILSWKEGGFDEQITESATNVSGGQRQRRPLRGALIRKPDVYVFDDSFSALDFKTDRKLRRMLKKETGNAIVMVVAQRISSIMDADCDHCFE